LIKLVIYLVMVEVACLVLVIKARDLGVLFTF